MFSPKSSAVLYFLFRSMLYLKLILVFDMRQRQNMHFTTGIFTYSSTICGKNFSPYWITLVSLSKNKQTNHKYGSVSGCSFPPIYLLMLMSVLHCLYYHRLIVSLEIKWFKSSNFILFQDCFCHSNSSAFPYEFQTQPDNFQKKVCYNFA